PASGVANRYDQAHLERFLGRTRSSGRAGKREKRQEATHSSARGVRRHASLDRRAFAHGTCPAENYTALSRWLSKRRAASSHSVIRRSSEGIAPIGAQDRWVRKLGRVLGPGEHGLNRVQQLIMPEGLVEESVKECQCGWIVRRRSAHQDEAQGGIV